MDEKFAPGPWVYDKYGSLIDANNDPIRVYGLGITTELANQRPSSIANAKLITAAPELYEALQELCDIAMDNVSENSLVIIGAVEKAEQVLSKARGELETKPD